MGQKHNKIRLPAPLMLLAAIETGVYSAMPCVAASILGRDLPGIDIPTPLQIVVFTAILALTAWAMGLYSMRARLSGIGDLSRSTWAFALAGAALAFVAEVWSAGAMRVSVTVLALLVAFFVQRTLRLVYFDAVHLPGAPARFTGPRGSGIRVHH